MNTITLKSLLPAWLILTAMLQIAAAQPRPNPKAATPPPAKEWWFHPHKDHTPSGAPEDVKYKDYRVCYLGDTRQKVIYLTFDLGYENGNTPKVLDALKAEGVHATFFLTRYYMKEAPELVKRIIAEGHLAANHSATHPEHLGDMDDDRIRREITETAQYYKQLTGQEMTPLFRPPCGACTERVLRITSELGWRPVFWSMAYEDWTSRQKGKQFAIDYVMKYHHPGAVILLHPYTSNTTALPEIIRKLKADGYQFDSLRNLHDERTVVAGAPVVAAKP